MKLQVIISLVTLGFLIGLGDAQNCALLAAEGNCDFYPQCVETRIPCGSSGYALGYGEKYCHIFAEQFNCFTSEGQHWINNVRICLMQKLINSAVYINKGTCQELFQFAFSSHPECYANNGFCTDILLIGTNLCCLRHVYQLTDFLTLQAFHQVIETAKICDQQTADRFLSAAGDFVYSFGVCVKELINTLIHLLWGCETGFDLVFVVDSSANIGSINFDAMKKFIVNITASFEISANATRVGIIQFSDTANIVIPLGSIDKVQELTTAINNIAYIGNGTMTDIALDLVPASFTYARINEGLPRVVILLTYSKSNDSTLTAQAAARVHDANIQVYSVGIGSSIDEYELLEIASDPNYVYKIANFSSESFAVELRPLQLTACTTPSVTDISQQLQNTIGRNQSQTFKYEYHSEGFTIKIEVIVGGLVVYGSFSIPTPSSVTADFKIYATNKLDYFVSPSLYNSVYGDGQGQYHHLSENAILYISLVGQENNNTFILNTTFGDTTDSGVGVSSEALKVFLFSTLIMMITVY